MCKEYFAFKVPARAQKANTLSPRKFAIPNSRNSQIRVFESCPFPLNSRSRTPKFANFADGVQHNLLSLSRSNPY